MCFTRAHFNYFTNSISSADRVTAFLGRPHLKAQHLPERAGDLKHSLADLGRAKKILSYAPVVEFDAGLRRTLEWYRGVPG